MKKTLLLLGLILLQLGLSPYAIAQDPFASLLKKVEEFTKKYPQEKVHLHLDKPYYAIGDDIWFKAYVIDAKTTAPTTISNILYVELIDGQDSLRKQLKLPMQDGLTWGDFKLSDSLSEGNYRIRAYTQLMRNAGPDFFFDKTIKIGNSWANKVFTKTSYQLSQQDLAEKVNSTIQFTDQSGNPYANHDVSYEVQLNGKSISRGKSQTNANGEINITTLNKTPNVYASGNIVATITLADKQKISKTIPLKTSSSQIDVQFFPEGGHMVRGLPSKIGIKAINASGKGEDVSGTIITNDDVEVGHFKTSYLGMGSFYLNPIANKNYKAKVKFSDSTEKLFDLPKIENSGYVLSVDNRDSVKMNIRILTSPDLLNKGELKLMVHQNGNVFFSANIPSTKPLMSTRISKTELPSGLITLTLFSTANIPLAERIIFINNSWSKIDVTAQDLKSNYGPREKVALNFLNTNGELPIQGNYSVSVTNATIVKPDLENESNILTSLLLTADLKGYVEKPNYYFLSDDAKNKADLDDLLLTQGWRKINWQNMGTNQSPNIAFEPEKTLQISGTITNLSNKPINKGKVLLFSNIGGFFSIDTLSNEKGQFKFDNLIFKDSTAFVVQARTEKDRKNVQIKIDHTPNQQITANKNAADVEVNINEELKDYLQKSDDYFNELTKTGMLSRTIMLNKVEIKTTRNKAPDYSSNLNGPGNADAVFTAKDLETANSIDSYLGGRVAGLRINQGIASLMSNNGRPMRIVIGGMMMPQDFTLDNIVVQDIESIEVLKSISNTAIYGMNGGGGILLFTTKRGGGSSSSYATPGIINIKPKGYHLVREFYSPKYDTNPSNNPDLRTTVYWNPNFSSDAEGKSNINFYNTDQAGTYRIVIEGIDANGNLARKVYTYEVK